MYSNFNLVKQLRKVILEEENLFRLEGLNLKLQEDQEFIRKMSTAHYLRYVLVIKNFLSMTDLNREENSNEKEIVVSNIKNLKEFSKSVNDNYCANLLEKDLNLLTSNEIKSEFNKVKKRIIFDTFTSSQVN